MPYLSEQNRPKFTVGMKNDLARFLEWSIRTVFSPNSRLVDDQIQNLFEKAYNQLTLYGSHASKKFASVARAPTSDADVQLQILKVLEEIRDNQRLLLEQTRPRRGLFAWFGTGLRRLLPKRQPKPKPVEIKAQPTKPKKERRQRRRRRTPSESKAVSEASTKVKVAEQSPTEPVATEVIPRFETREIDGPISPIRGFSTSNKPRMRSLKYPPEPSILVSLLKAIEKQRASGEGWADLNESCVDIPNLSRNRRDATISEIRSATGHVRTDEMPDWDKIPATVELVELLEVNSLTKMSTSPAFDYLDLPSTLGLVSVYFAQARSALDDSEE